MELLERIDSFLTVEGLKENWTVLALTAIFGIALWLRYQPEKGMQYLQALDPYLIFRMSRHLALEGNLPALDFLRYFPYPAPNYTLQFGDILFPAILYAAGGFAFFPGYLEFAQFYPAFAGAVGVVFMYFLGRELFERRTGIASAFFLATIAGVMHRTSAGFFEKEPTGTMFMMMSLYFFTRAWKRKEWLSGIASGLTLAFFTASWGGGRMMWLLYPLVVGFVAFIDEDIDSLITTYTPVVIVGGFTAAALDAGRFSLAGPLFVSNLALLGLVWSRYLLEVFEILEDKQLTYYVPSISAAGLVFVFLSPLFWDFPYMVFRKIMAKVTQSSGAVIAGTVAENTAPGLQQIITQLGSAYASQVSAILALPSYTLGTWPLAYTGIALIASPLALMIGRKYGILDQKIPGNQKFAAFQAVFISFTLGFMVFFQGSRFWGILTMAALSAILLALVYRLDGESSFSLMSIGLISLFSIEFFVIAQSAAIGSLAAIIQNLLASGFSLAVLYPTALVLAATGLKYWTEDFQEFEIEYRWYYTLPLFWAVTNILGAVAKSRLVFLSTFSVALSAGYSFSIIWRGAEKFDYGMILETGEEKARQFTVAGLIILVGLITLSAGYAASQGLGGSPNQAWMQSINYMEEETEPGSVIMSWWDYGYWFESIGRRPAVADGGNAGYYSSQRYGKTNYPIADFFTSSSPENHTDLFRRHSVDYIVLDSSMIGKYSAVSQISNRDNSKFESMITLSSRKSLRDTNQDLVRFSNNRARLSILAPIERENNSIDISTGRNSLMQSGGGRVPVSCVLTSDGIREIGNSSQSSPYCIAEDPYQSFERSLQTGGSAGIVLVPRSIAGANLVRLYLMDGHGIEFVEKIPEASNGYVKMWKVEPE